MPEALIQLPAIDSRSGDSCSHGIGMAECAFIVIANLAHLAEVYGSDFSLGISQEIKRRICENFVTDEAADLRCVGSHGFLLRTNEAFKPFAEPGHPNPQIEALLAASSSKPVRFRGVSVLVHLHADWLPPSGSDIPNGSEIEILSWAWSSQPLPSTLDDEACDAWRTQYRGDMEMAVRVSDALAAARLELLWCPVIDSHDAARTIYREAISRIAPQIKRSAPLSSKFFVPSLERLGLGRLFDRLVLQMVVSELRAHPNERVAVKISFQSARVDHWWASMLRTLEADPHLARRLIVEIASGTGPFDFEAAREFCTQLQQLGSRIALDDVGAAGVDWASTRNCSPDIVKIGPAFVRQARQCDAGRAKLRSVLATCSRLSPIVVVDGIETEEDLRTTLRLGARWLQGYYLGGPDTHSRGLVVSPDCTLTSIAAAPANESRFCSSRTD